MNAEQKAELIKLIEGDCLLQCEYINDCGDTCAIGQLALAAGVSKDTLTGAGRAAISYRPTADETIADSLRNIRTSIFNKFGLNYQELSRIQYLNDDIESLIFRRIKIVEYLNTIPLTT